jgi:outer membrane protein assembly factor BamB
MPARRAFLGAVGGTATALAGCLARAPSATFEFDPLGPTSLDDHAHAQFQGGIRNRHYVVREVPEAVHTDWAVPVNRGAHTAAKSSPVTTPDGDVVVAADTGTVRRVSPDGEVRWTADVDYTQRGIHGTPAIANETAYVGAYDGALYAFDLTSGERRWRQPLGDAIGSSPVYHHGVVYIAVEYYEPSGSVAAVDAATGDVRWFDDWPTSHPHSTIGIDPEAGRLVVGSNDGNCYAWTFPGLERAWAFETGRPIKGPVAVHRGTAIFGSWDRTLYGVALADGSERWRVDTGGEVMAGPAVGPGPVAYVGNHAGTVFAVDARSGEVRWETDTHGSVIGSLAATAEHVLVGSYDRHLYALRADDGSTTWRHRGEGRATSAPLVTKDAIYYAERRPDEDEPGNCYRLVPA